MTKKRVSEFRSYAWIKTELQKAGWNTRNPNTDINGQVYYQQECLDHPEMKSALGKQRPEFVVKLNDTEYWVIEAKASVDDLEVAFNEATEYGKDINKSSFIKAKIVTGVAGSDSYNMLVKSAFLEPDGTYKVITYNGTEITSLISVERSQQLLNANLASLIDLVPEEHLLLATAEDINEVLHNGSINKDERAKVISAILLSLIDAGGPDLKTNSVAVFIESINSRAKQILEEHGKVAFYPNIQLKLPEKQNAQKKYRKALVETIYLLHKIDIKAAMNSGTDVLGKFYEVFLKYGNGAKDIGIVLTPRHITKFACEMLNLNYKDVVYDPTCGTGGFLVAAFDYVRKISSPSQVKEFKDYRIFGIEQDATVTTLAIVNMIFRGDGKSHIMNDDCFPVNLIKSSIDGISTAIFSEKDGPKPVTKVLMNPPFSKKNENEKEHKFVEHALQQMEDGGLLFAIVPTSVMIKGGALKSWRQKLLAGNTLLSVVTFTEDLFYPVGTRTVGIFIKKGIPHDKKTNVLWAKVTNDGYVKSKGKRLPSRNAKNDLDVLGIQLFNFIHNPKADQLNIHEFLKTCPIDFSDDLLELMPEVYLDEKYPTLHEIIEGANEYFREYVSFLIKKGVQLELAKPKITDIGHIKMPSNFKLFTLEHFVKHFKVGSVHSISEVSEGTVPLISCKTEDNGIVGKYDVSVEDTFMHAYTLAGDGSYPITTFYHYYQFGAYDNVNVCPIKDGIDLSTIFFIASRLNRMRWRYSYGRKCYHNKVKKIAILLPVDNKGLLDQTFIQQLFENLYGWPEIYEFIREDRQKLLNSKTSQKPI